VASLGALDLLGESLAGRLALEARVLAGVDQDAVVGIRFLAHVGCVGNRLTVPVVRFGCDDGPDLDALFLGEGMVALVVGRDGHQRAGPDV